MQQQQLPVFIYKTVMRAYVCKTTTAYEMQKQ